MKYTKNISNPVFANHMISWDTWDEYHSQLKEEVDTAVDIWTKILQDRGAKKAYVKGSGVKEWNGPIDYVPIISDIDIHLDFGNPLAKIPLENSLAMSREYEEEFHNIHSIPLHLPRLQIMDINMLYNDPEMIPPLLDQIQPIIGEPNLKKISDIEFIRQIDQKRLEEVKEIQSKLSEMMIDRTGNDLWVALRRLVWRISPIPARVLSQHQDLDPLVIWGWNRSKLVETLQEYNHVSLAILYTRYYQNCWELFANDFQSIKLYHNCILSASAIFDHITRKYLS